MDMAVQSDPVSESSRISCIPEELLLLIFHTATYQSDADGDAFAIPVVLSHVCRSWRAIALDTSTLWTTIILTYQCLLRVDTSDVRPQAVFRQAEAFLARSRSRPLAVTVDLTIHEPEIYDPDRFRDLGYTIHVPHNLMEDPSYTFPMATHVLALLLPRARFIREFTLLGHDWITIWYTIHGFGTAEMPLLEEFDACLNNSPAHTTRPFALFTYPQVTDGLTRIGVDYPPSVNSYQCRHPKLKSLIVEDMRFLQWARLSLGNLHTLSITELDSESRPSFVELRCLLLANSHSLVEFTICTSGSIHDHRDSTLSSSFWRSIPLPNLRKLFLGYGCLHDVTHFIHGLYVPNLKALVIEDVCEPSCLARPPDRARYRDERDATSLFELLVKDPPFPPQQLESLELLNVALDPPPAALRYPSTMDTSAINCPMDFPFQFLLALVSLKNLTLGRPDPSILSALNTPVRKANGQCPAFFINPLLEHIKVYDTKAEVVFRFLFQRSTFIESPIHTIQVLKSVDLKLIQKERQLVTHSGNDKKFKCVRKFDASLRSDKERLRQSRWPDKLEEDYAALDRMLCWF